MYTFDAATADAIKAKTTSIIFHQFYYSTVVATTEAEVIVSLHLFQLAFRNENSRNMSIINAGRTR